MGNPNFSLIFQPDWGGEEFSASNGKAPPALQMPCSLLKTDISFKKSVTGGGFRLPSVRTEGRRIDAESSCRHRLFLHAGTGLRTRRCQAGAGPAFPEGQE